MEEICFFLCADVFTQEFPQVQIICDLKLQQVKGGARAPARSRQPADKHPKPPETHPAFLKVALTAALLVNWELLQPVRCCQLDTPQSTKDCLKQSLSAMGGIRTFN